MAGKAHNFHKCNCPGLDDEVDRLYRQIEQIDTDSKVDALQTGASPFDGILVGQDKESRIIESINFYSLAHGGTSFLPAHTAVALPFSDTLPTELTTLPVGAQVLGYDSGKLIGPTYSVPSGVLNYQLEWTIEHSGSGVFDGTIAPKVFNSGTADITPGLPSGTLHFMVFRPQRI